MPIAEQLVGPKSDISVHLTVSRFDDAALEPLNCRDSGADIVANSGLRGIISAKLQGLQIPTRFLNTLCINRAGVLVGSLLCRSEDEVADEDMNIRVVAQCIRSNSRVICF
jgi:hypothetical protein